MSLLVSRPIDGCGDLAQPGIGTWFNPGVVSPLFRWGAKVLDEAFAWYLDAHVIEGYKFLMQNYRVGDKICIFGFSRGSYTARALAGLLYKVGLLPRNNEQQIPFAYRLYKRTDKTGLGLCAGFKQTFCQDVKVEFVGVWDTVASVGLLAGRTLPFTNTNKAIKTFRHALSLDERRAKFRPSLYHRPAPSKAAAQLNPEHDTPVAHGGIKASTSAHRLLKKRVFAPIRSVKRFFTRDLPMLFMDSTPEDDGTPNTDVLEVWFTGSHGDVGGGNVPDAMMHSLANISLRWMVRHVQQANCGIIFDERALERAEIPAMPILPTTNTNTATLGDQLVVGNKLWWLLEIIPLTYSWQDPEGVWHRKLSINFGRGRKIADKNPNFHETVKIRMDDPKLNYTPKARWDRQSEVYVQ
ncbi:hypothetical protein C0991_005492 [Blastosporella zonata]|nr:hypothetical protein C0991_005492 [Blastosporella zonata]